MSLLIKALGLIFLAALLVVFLKKKGGEFSFLITACAVCIVGVYVILTIGDSVGTLKSLMEQNGQNSDYIIVAVKALIIAYLAETVADTCRDFGQQALASKAELAGKCVIFVLAVPILSNVLEVVLKYMEL